MTKEDLTIDQLLACAIENGEGVLASTGAFVTNTGKRTGRSPKDRFIVKDSVTADTVHWGAVNQPTTPAIFDALWQKTEEHFKSLDQVYLSHLQVGASKSHGVAVNVTTEFAWHSLFAKHLFIDDNSSTTERKDTWTIHSAATLTTDPAVDGTYGDGAVMINFTARKILLCGMRYAGEMKKSMFTVLNFLLTDEDILPMHCSSNVSDDGVVTLFFGLSGTGKTTLSADENCLLIGDDEHGWTPNSVFNFEGGCYAKTINLSQKQEPEIWHAISQKGAILENVVLDSSGTPDYDDDRHTQNTRGAYSRSYLSRCAADNAAGSPSVVVFLTCDCYSVLPPLASLTKEQAAYYFLSGYTALVGSTEVGSTSAIKPTFSTCFGAPFFPRPAQVYAELLMKRITETNAQVYLINTGWTGGAYGQGGHRFEISTTRKMVAAATSGTAAKAQMKVFPGFGFMVPQEIEGVDSKLLTPKASWQDQDAYDTQANTLIDMFQDNFKKFSVSDAVLQAGPTEIIT